IHVLLGERPRRKTWMRGTSPRMTGERHCGRHTLRNFVEQIEPTGILAVNQTHLPGARPVFDRLLALNGRANIVVQFKVNELLQAVLPGEPTQQTAAMFAATTDEIAGDADIKSAIAAIRHDVDEAAGHQGSRRVVIKSRGTSPRMTDEST